MGIEIPEDIVFRGRQDCTDFIESGMLWWVNRILHTFGWALVVTYGSDSAGKEWSFIFPRRVPFFGSDRDVDLARLRDFRETCRALPDAPKV